MEHYHSEHEATRQAPAPPKEAVVIVCSCSAASRAVADVGHSGKLEDSRYAQSQVEQQRSSVYPASQPPGLADGQREQQQPCHLEQPQPAQRFVNGFSTVGNGFSHEAVLTQLSTLSTAVSAMC
jgi:hypothetical protein